MTEPRWTTDRPAEAGLYLVRGRRLRGLGLANVAAVTVGPAGRLWAQVQAVPGDWVDNVVGREWAGPIVAFPHHA